MSKNNVALSHATVVKPLPLHTALWHKNNVTNQGDFKSPESSWIQTDYLLRHVPQNYLNYTIGKTAHTGRVTLAKGQKIWALHMMPLSSERGDARIAECGTILSQKVSLLCEESYFVFDETQKIIGIVAFHVRAIREVATDRKDRKIDIKASDRLVHDPDLFDRSPEPPVRVLGGSYNSELLAYLCQKDETPVVNAKMTGTLVKYVKKSDFA